MKWFSLILLIFIFSQGAFGAEKMDFYTAVKADTVFFITTRTLRAGENVLVESKGAGDSDFVRLNEIPIVADMDPFSVRQKLGNMYTIIADATGSEDPQSALLALRTDDFYGMIFSLLDSRVGTLLGRYFLMPGHQDGQTYTYRLILRERDGKILDTVERLVVLREKPPQHAPKISAAQVGNRIHVSWEYPDWSGDRDDMAIRFQLERKENNGSFESIRDKIFPRIGADFYHYFDDKIYNGGSYTYRIRAIDVANLTGPVSKEIEIFVRDIAAPSKPAGLEAEVNGKSVKLSWFPNPEPDLSHYNVFRMEVEKGDSIRINSLPILPEPTEFTDSSIVYKHTYYYAVIAVDSAGNESRPSEHAHVLATDTTPPEAPTGLAARVSNRTVALVWHPVTDNDLSGYRVSRSMNERSFFPINQDLLQDTSYLDLGPKEKTLEPGRRYFYAVKAVDSLSNTSDAAGIWITIPDDDPPSPPGQVTVRNQHGRFLEVSWNPSPSRDVAQYSVVRIFQNEEQEIGTYPRQICRIQDDSLAMGQSVQYGVTTIDTAGNKSERKLSYPEILRDYDPPPGPRFVEAALIDHTVKIQWDPVGSFDIAGYNVYRSGLPTGVGEKVNATIVQDNVFTDPEGQKEHWYWVKVVDHSGNESEKSAAVPVRVNTASQ